MSLMNMKNPEPMCETQQLRPQGMFEVLRTKKKQLEMELEKINRALDAYEKHPDVAEVFESISRVNLY